MKDHNSGIVGEKKCYQASYQRLHLKKTVGYVNSNRFYDPPINW